MSTDVCDFCVSMVRYHMTVPIETAKKTPHILVWINRITEIEDQNDEHRREINASVESICTEHDLPLPCKLKKFSEVVPPHYQEPSGRPAPNPVL